MRKCIPVLLLICLALTSFGQDFLHVPISNDLNDIYERAILESEEINHLGIKPYRFHQTNNDVKNLWPFDIPQKDSAASFIERAKHNLLYDDFLYVRTKDYQLALNPLMEFSVGYQNNNDSGLYRNTRGFQVKGDIKCKLAFEANFYENQARFPTYLSDYVFRDTIVPSQARPKGFRNNSFDFAWANGYITWQADDWLNIELGHGKHFFGNGHRSLLLSDNSFSYPYLSLTAEIWRIKYMTLYTELLDIDFNSKNFLLGFPKKYGTFHYLSLDIGNKFQLGLFESVVWQATDTSGNFRGFDLTYLNPVIFFRPTEFALGSPDNASIGLDLSYRVFPKTMVYGQLIIDDLDFGRSRDGDGFYRNKWGWQLGFKGYDPFGIEGLSYRAEVNTVRPFTYAHKIPLQNYAHYNQPLAHPMGANFVETNGMISYRYKRWLAKIYGVYGVTGFDENGEHFGQDIFVSDFNISNFPDAYGHSTLQGLRTQMRQIEVKFAYVVNPKINLNFELSLNDRLGWNETGRLRDTWFTFGLRTNLYNRYYDLIRQ